MTTQERGISKRQIQREASYEALVRSAMHVFNQNGYSSVRVEDIVASTGYSRGAFYLHFKNKEDCFWHVIEHREQLRGNWQGFARELTPETASLEEVVGQAMQGMSESMDGVQVWIMELADFFRCHRYDPATVQRLADLWESWQNELVIFLVILQDGGWISKERSARMIAGECLAYVDGLIAHQNIFGVAPEEHFARLNDGLIRLLG